MLSAIRTPVFVRTRLESPDGNGMALKVQARSTSKARVVQHRRLRRPSDPGQLTAPGTAGRGSIDGPGYQTAGHWRLPQLQDLRAPDVPIPCRGLQRGQPYQRQTVVRQHQPRTFGEVTGYRDARILQFAGRFRLLRPSQQHPSAPASAGAFSFAGCATRRR